MKYALVINGVIDTISLEPQSGEDWIEAPDNVFAGFLRDGDGWVEPPAPPPAVPDEVSRFQTKAALALAGLLPQADTAVAASGNVVLQLAWAEATTFKRNSPGINVLAPAIGLDDAALDKLFIAAAGIVA